MAPTHLCHLEPSHHLCSSLLLSVTKHDQDRQPTTLHQGPLWQHVVTTVLVTRMSFKDWSGRSCCDLLWAANSEQTCHGSSREQRMLHHHTGHHYCLFIVCLPATAHLASWCPLRVVYVGKIALCGLSIKLEKWESETYQTMMYVKTLLNFWYYVLKCDHICQLAQRMGNQVQRNARLLHLC